MELTHRPDFWVKGMDRGAETLYMQLATLDTTTIIDGFSSIDTTVELSHSYDAYGVHGSLERISIVASRVWAARAAGALAGCDLDDLQTALFVTQRGWHSDAVALEPDIGVEWELITAINEASGGPSATTARS